MQKKWGLSLVLSVVVSLLTSQAAQARSDDAIVASGVLKIGVPADYAPLGFFDSNDKLVGFDIEMSKAFAQSKNLSPVFVITSWPTLARDLSEDLFDIAVGGVTYTDERAKQFLLSKPILPNGKIALARCAIAPQLSSFEKIDLPYVNLVVNPGGTNEKFVNQRIKLANVIRVKNNIDNLDALRQQTADVMITDLIEGEYYQYKEPGVLCLATQQPFTGTESYKVYMVQQQNPQLMTQINQWLANTDIAQIASQWGIPVATTPLAPIKGEPVAPNNLNKIKLLTR